jgi:hypothetical protein
VNFISYLKQPTGDFINLEECHLPGMLRLVALVRIDVSDERVLSIIRVTRTGNLETLAVTSNRSTLQKILCGKESVRIGYKSEGR